MVTRQPRCRSTYSRYSTTSRSARSASALRARTSRPGSAAKSRDRRPERVGDRAARRPRGSARPGRPPSAAVQRAAQLRDLDEVVEVPGLQAGVLPVVDERQQLAGLGGSSARVDGSQAAHDRWRSARVIALERPSGVEGGQLGEVVAADLLVGHPAAQAERERRRARTTPAGPRRWSSTAAVRRRATPSSGRYFRLLSSTSTLAGVGVGDQPATPAAGRPPSGSSGHGQVVADVEVAGDAVAAAGVGVAAGHERRLRRRGRSWRRPGTPGRTRGRTPAAAAPCPAGPGTLTW